jgi:hypothetical protein
LQTRGTRREAAKEVKSACKGTKAIEIAEKREGGSLPLKWRSPATINSESSRFQSPVLAGYAAIHRAGARLATTTSQTMLLLSRETSTGR